MELGKIPWLAIMEYADRHGLDGGNGLALAAIVRAIDDRYLEVSRERSKAQRP